MMNDFTIAVSNLRELMERYAENVNWINYEKTLPAYLDELEPGNKKVAFHLTMIELGHGQMLDQGLDEHQDALNLLYEIKMH